MRQLPTIGLVYLLICLGISAPARATPGIAAGSSIHVSATTQAAARNMNVAGHLGGLSNAVAVRGRYAYVGMGTELAILDVLDPTHPVRVGYVVLPNLVLAIAIDGDYAYVGLGSVYNDPEIEAGLQVVSIANPAAPALAGYAATPSGKAQAVAVANGRAYVAAYEGLTIFDVSNPLSPAQLSYIDVPGEAKDVVFAGANLLVIGPDCGLCVVDVTNPAAPAVIGAYKASGYAWRAAVAGDLALVAADGAGLWIVNIANPAAPKQIALLDLGTFVRDVAIVGHYAYALASYPAYAILTFDITNPSAPREVGRAPTTGYSERFNVAGGYVYTISYEFGMHIFSLAQPALPRDVGSYATLSTPSVLSIAGSYAYINSVNNQVNTLDTSNPAALSRIAQTTVAGDYSTADLAVAGRYLYTSGHQYAVHVFDRVNPAQPVEIGKLFGEGYDFIVGGTFQVDGGKVYVDGALLNMANPRSPTLGALPVFPGPFPITDIAVSGRYAYALSNGCSRISQYCKFALQIDDISNPQAPQLIADYARPNAASQIVIDGAYAYLAGNSAALAVLDVSNPTAPREVASLGQGQTVNELVVDGGLAYLAEQGGVRVIDVTLPAQPIEVGWYPTPSPVTDLAVVGGLVYAAAGNSGLFVLRYTGPSVEGIVTDALGRPIAGVMVATSSGPSATTDASGAYRIGGLDRGAVTITASKSGLAFAPASVALQLPQDRTAFFVALAQPASTTLQPGAAATLAYTDTQGLPTRFSFASGAVSQTTTLTVTPGIGFGGAGLFFTGHAFTISAARGGVALPQLAFGAPVAFSLSYGDDEVFPITGEGALVLQWWSGSAWLDAAQTCAPPATYGRDTVQNTLGGAFCRAGQYRLVGPTHTLFLSTVQQ